MTKKPETHEEAAALLGLSGRATRDELLTAIAAHAKEARSLHDPAMLATLTRDVEARLRDKHGEDFALLRQDAVEMATQRAVNEWRTRGKAAQQTGEAALAFVQQDLARVIAARKVLGGEASEPAANRTERLLAQLLDTHAEAAAAQWLSTQPADRALARYHSADDTDRAYARTFERMQAAGLIDVSAAANPITAARAIREAVEARQAARVPASLTEAVALAERLAVDLARSSGAPAQIIAAAGREGTAPPVLHTRARTASDEAVA
jgi:hypothetical protein